MLLRLALAGLVWALAAPAQQQSDYLLVHVAGLVDNGAGRLAEHASLVRPLALTGDDRGNVYVAFANRIYMVEASSELYEHVAGNGGVRTSGDGGPAVEASFGPIRGVAWHAGALYVAQAGPCVIRRVDLAGGIVSTVGGTGECVTATGPVDSTPIDPVALAFDPQGRLVFASTDHRVGRIDLAVGEIVLVAGTGEPGGAGDGGPAAAAQLNAPAGIAVDPAGNIYVAESAGHAIRKIDAATGVIATVAGTRAQGSFGDGGPATATLIDSPRAIALDPSGTKLYFGQGRAARVVDLIAGSIDRLPPPFLDVGRGVWVNSDGEVILSDHRAQSIVKVRRDGKSVRIAGRGNFGEDGPGPFATMTPRDVHITPEGRLLISDGAINRKVRAFEGGVVTTIATSAAGGLASDEHGFVYVMDDIRQSVLRIAPGGAVERAPMEVLPSALGIASERDGSALHTREGSPGLALDAEGNLYVADPANKVLRVVSPVGEETTLAGNGMDGFTTPVNGAARDIGVGAVLDVAVDADGNIFFLGGAEDGVSGVWRLDRASGQVRLIAGGPDAAEPLTRLWGVDVDARGVVYLADEENGRILGLVPSTMQGPYVTGAIAPSAFGAGDEIAPGGWFEIYGLNLAPRTTDWSGVFLAGAAPNLLEGVSVLVNGAPAALSLVSPGQINGQAPLGLILGSATIEVLNAQGSSNVVALRSNGRAGWMLAPPSFHSGFQQFVVAILPDGAFAGPPGLIPGVTTRPVRAGEIVVMYGVGFGAVSPAVAPGTVAQGPTALPNPRVTIGGREAHVLYAGLTPGAVGLYQFNVEAPAGVSGDAKLEVTAAGESTGQPLWIQMYE